MSADSVRRLTLLAAVVYCVAIPLILGACLLAGTRIVEDPLAQTNPTFAWVVLGLFWLVSVVAVMRCLKGIRANLADYFAARRGAAQGGDER